MRFFKRFVPFAVMVLVGFSLMSCAEEQDVSSVSSAATAASPDSYPFVMGATDLPVGTVNVWNDETNLYVQYVMNTGYELGEAHVCVSTAPLAWVPPGQCPYQQDPMPADTTTFTFTIPLADIGPDAVGCDTLLYLQVHSAVLNGVTDAKLGSAYSGTFKGQIAYDVTCDLPPEEFVGCTRTQGYWKTKPGAWPVSSLVIGGVTYSKTQLLNLLKSAPRGDASLILADQLISSMLDAATGTSVPPTVQDAIDDAQAWMAANKDADGLLAYGIGHTKDETLPNPLVWDQAISLGAVLDAYNNGLLGPPHCQ